jgi:integrase
MAKLTAASVDKWKPKETRQQIADHLVPGLYFLVQPSGAKSWTLRYRAGGVQRRQKIGGYPAVSLAEARNKARDIKMAVDAGDDPQAKVARVKADTVQAVFDDYKRYKLDRLKSGENAAGFLRRSVVREWGHRPISKITKRDVSKMLFEIVESGREVTANRTLAHARAFFNWAVDNGYAESAPTDRVKMPAKEESRDRWLNDAEIALFWEVTGDMGTPYRQALRLLLLTGCRASEITGLRAGEFDGAILTLPPDRTKNGTSHVLPLPKIAVEELESLPVIGAGEFLVTTTGEGPIWNINKKCDEAWQAMRDIAGDSMAIERFRPHDLRRTLETGMARLGIAESVVDRITNHISAQSKMRRVYDRHDYLREKQEALAQWADHVLGV